MKLTKEERERRERLAGATNGITESIKRWNNLFERGGSDPGYPDGVNMNLVRNHVRYYKREIEAICEETGLSIPDEYRLPTPPYIDNNYFARPESERAKRIMSRPGWRCYNHERIGIDRSGRMEMLWPDARGAQTMG